MKNALRLESVFVTIESEVIELCNSRRCRYVIGFGNSQKMAQRVSLIHFENRKDTMSTDFIFILNFLDPDVEFPFEISDGISFERADIHQLRPIRHFVSQFSYDVWEGQSSYSGRPYEFSVDSVDNFAKETQLDHTAFRYWVLNITPPRNISARAWLFEDIGLPRRRRLDTLRDALTLSNSNIRLGFINNIQYFVPNASAYFQNTNLLSHFNPEKLECLTGEHKREISTCYELLCTVKLEGTTVGRILEELELLERLPDRATLKTIGYFAIMEALLTHSPTQGVTSPKKHTSQK